MTPQQAYEWLAPKLSTAERSALDVIFRAADASRELKSSLTAFVVALSTHDPEARRTAEDALPTLLQLLQGATPKAMKEHGDSLRQFVRNGVWGTCAGCPRDSSRRAYPELCGFFDRHDHRLPLLDLAHSVHRGAQR
ncbi:MAG TPA: hypothetical protein VJ608_06745 [Albitalea sp.]|nr:hypothetical protein [Albitalea sp.]